MVSSTQVQIFPQATTIERDALTVTVNGTTLYNTDTGTFDYTINLGSSWEKIASLANITLDQAYRGDNFLDLLPGVNLNISSSAGSPVLEIVEAGVNTTLSFSAPFSSAIDLDNNDINNVGVMAATNALVNTTLFVNQVYQSDPALAPNPLLYIAENLRPFGNGNVTWEFRANALNSGSATYTYAQQEIISSDATLGSERGDHSFYVSENGVLQEYLRLTGSVNQVNIYKTLDLKGNTIVAASGINGSAGALDFQNFGDLRVQTFGSNDLQIESLTGQIKINNNVVYVPDGQVLSTISANTTYIFLGDHEFTNPLVITQPGVVIKGTGRENSKIFGSFAGPLIDIQNQDFELSDITLSATGDDTIAVTGFNLTSGDPNEGRLKTVNITNCQLRNCVNGMLFFGFDLIDISQTLFYYFQSRTDSGAQIGIEFEGTSKVELSSCEFLRWFEESTIALPINYFVGNMIRFINSTVPAVGFGAVSISNCIIHPQQNQNGIVIDNSATFGFANLTGNVFVDTNLNTPTFLPLVIDIDLQPSWIIEANQGVPNYKAFINAEVDNNATVTTIGAASTPTAILASTFIDNGSSRVTLNTTTGEITKDSKRSNYFTINLTGLLEIQSGGNNQNVQIGLFRNGAPSGPTTKLEADAGVPQGFSFNVIGFAEEFDTFQVYVQNDSGANDILVSNLSLAGVEV